MKIHVTARDVEERHWLPDEIFKIIFEENIKIHGFEIVEIRVEREAGDPPAESRSEEWKR